MRSIQKYTIPAVAGFEYTIDGPPGTIRHVAMEGDAIAVWIEVTQIMSSRFWLALSVYQAGQKIPGHLTYFGTVTGSAGSGEPYAWHVYGRTW